MVMIRLRSIFEQIKFPKVRIRFELFPRVQTWPGENPIPTKKAASMYVRMVKGFHTFSSLLHNHKKVFSGKASFGSRS